MSAYTLFLFHHHPMDTESQFIFAFDPDDHVFDSSGGSMFAGSQHFTVAGGTFNNSTINYVTPPAAPPGSVYRILKCFTQDAKYRADFRMISMGDIDLQKELTVNKEWSAIGRRREHGCVRRMYSAKVDGRKSDLTVGVYQGHGAEEDWQRDTEIYMSVRHPNIIQIWAGASDGNIHATVFHGDLVPLEAFLARQSPIMTVYLCAYCWTEWLVCKFNITF
ncbi:hypothetical protein C8F04DRAFT_1093805 [Mycena alexandri]|uniref:Protein kinase domain-containing protein n=1 Tax=Mycena alexandri TaxID=1745969 RepID=A0AAD6X641_9AGAR|nr:hypothetical protein C8F04DRAFT_1093805 [Mycena alexandri]